MARWTRRSKHKGHRLIPRTVKTGGACAFYGDSLTSAPQLRDAGVECAMLDCLAEATTSALGRMLARRAGLFFRYIGAMRAPTPRRTPLP